MSLSRKHYIEIAKLILELRDVDWRFPETVDEGLSDFISSLCYYLK